MPQDILLKSHIPTDISERMRQYDAICKKLLAHRVILAWIIKECTDEFKDCSIDDIAHKYIEGKPEIAQVPVHPDATMELPLIEGVNTEDSSPTEGKVTYDIKFIAHAPTTGEPIRLIVNVEAQRNNSPGYPLIKRALYYCSRMISAQYGKEFVNSHYENIKKVYSIWICTNPKKETQNSITKYHLQSTSLYGQIHEAKANYDLLTAIMVNLGAEANQAAKNLLKLLTLLLRSNMTLSEKEAIIATEYDIKMKNDIRNEVENMCNLSLGVYEEGMEKGMEKGLERGETRFANLMKKLFDSGRMDDAMRVVQDEQYRAQLMKEFAIQ